MTFKKFKNTDIFHNTLEMNPSYDFVVYNGNVYLNNASGDVDLYDGVRTLGVAGAYPFEQTFSWSDGYGYVQSTPISGAAYPWIFKSSDKVSFKNMSSSSFALLEIGQGLTGSYPQTASISREYITSTAAVITGTANHLNSLQNTLNNYRTMSEYFNFDYYTGSAAVNLISIPSIIFGSSIKKGTVEMNFYVSGTLVGKLKDSNRNGELIQTEGVGTGDVAGVVLYNEGFALLTGTWDIGDGHIEGYNSATEVTASWANFGAGMNDGLSSVVPSSSFGLSFEGTTKTQTITLLAHAEKGEYNHSNNPTYKTYGQATAPLTSSMRYVEPRELTIKNVVSSSFSDTDADFHKTTYISSVAIYDEKRNLIGIAKVATPIRKDENIEYSIRMKLDI
jgi:hypothetical protein